MLQESSLCEWKLLMCILSLPITSPEFLPLCPAGLNFL